MYYTDAKHYAGCYCGSQSLEAHAVKKGTTTCIRCGGKASIGFEEIGVLSEDIKRSRNGSYILPNGVIVLVDKDIESYLSGTLVFYTDESFLMSFKEFLRGFSSSFLFEKKRDKIFSKKVK